jgi:hypothetical protein
MKYKSGWISQGSESKSVVVNHVDAKSWKLHPENLL